MTKHTPAVDIDVHDEEIVAEMVEFVHNLLGPSLLRTGLPPKTIIPCRTDMPFRKMSSRRYMFDGKSNQIEILCDGQQFVAFAIHPQTNKGYSWDDSDSFLDRQAGLSLDDRESGKSIANVKWTDLPLLTEEKAWEIVDHFEKIAGREGWDKVSGDQRSRDREFTGDPFENYKKPLDISLEKIRETLSNLDPDEDRDQWIMVGMALYHQFKGGAEGLSLWDEWSSRGAKYRDGRDQTPEEKWPSFEANLKNTNPVTFASILRLAKEKIKKLEAELLERVNTTVKLNSRRRRAYTWMDAEESRRDLIPPEWTVEGIIPKNSVGMIFGAPDSFKSFIGVSLGLSCSTGTDWFGHKVDEKMLALYVAGEGGSGFGRRQRAWEKKNKVKAENHMFRRNHYAAEITDLESALDVTESIKELIEESDKVPGIIFIDTLAANFGDGDENSTSDMTKFINHVNKYLREPFGCSVVIIHHTGYKNTERARGSTALKAGLDFEYRIERIVGDLTNLRIKMICTKMKESERSPDIYLRGEKEVLAFQKDDEGNDIVIDSLVFEIDDSPEPVVEEKPLVGKQKAIFGLLIKLTEDQEQVQRNVFRDIAVQQKLVTDNSDFRKNFHLLKKKRLVEEVEGEVRITDPFSK